MLISRFIIYQKSVPESITETKLMLAGGLRL